MDDVADIFLGLPDTLSRCCGCLFCCPGEEEDDTAERKGEAATEDVIPEVEAMEDGLETGATDRGVEEAEGISNPA